MKNNLSDIRTEFYPISIFINVKGPVHLISYKFHTTEDFTTGTYPCCVNKIFPARV